MRVLPVLLLALMEIPALAQTVAGMAAISGTIRDSSGAPIADAVVVVANTGKGIRRESITNEYGGFLAASLAPSSGYTVTVTKSGFAVYERREIDLLVGQNIALDIALQVATTFLQIEVETAAPLVEPARMDVSQVINSSQIQNLPINGRRVDTFVLLAPGVVPDGTFGLPSFRGIAGGNAFLTDGNDTTNQYFNENAGRTRIPTQLSQDAVQEFQVLIDGYSAEFGRASGGVVNTVTRSGSNDVHGTAYWFFRNQDFNARDTFASFNPPETRHQAGASIGGPIVRGKLFYFFNGETTRRDFPLSASLTTPPFFDANGRFVTTQPDGRLTCGPPATSEQCANAMGLLGRQNQLLERTANAELGFGKLDYRPNERHAVSASFNYLRWLSLNGLQTAAVLNNGAGIGNNATSTVRARYGRLAWTYLPGRSFVNEARFGWFKDKQFDYVSEALSWPGIGMLGLTIQGQQNLGTGVNYPRLNPSENRFQFAENLTWSLGNHTFQAGADVLHTEDYSDSLLNRSGTYTYPNFTAFALDYTGNTSGAKRWQNYSQGLGNPVVAFHIRDYAFYLQDRYRVSANLTVHFGVRYDYSALPQPIAMAESAFNADYPATGRIPTAGRNFAPRLGVAYALRPKTVLRAGFGLFHARYPGGLINTFITRNGMYQPSITFNGSVAADLARGPVFPARLPMDTPVSVGGNVDLTFPARDFRSAYTEQGNIAIDHELARNVALTVSYLWSRGLHLATARDINVGPLGDPVTYRINDGSGNQVGSYTTPTYRRANRVDPKWNRVNVVDAGGNSYYNALAVQLRKRISSGFEGSLAYTWSHAIDYNQGPGSNNIFFDRGPAATVFNGDYKGEKGSSVFDYRHRLVLATIWEPMFRDRTGVIGHLLNNWQFSQLSTFSSAPPATGTVVVSGTPFAGAAFNGSLNGLGGSTRVPFWPVNSMDIDQLARVDARVTKIIPIRERTSLHLNFEGFNVFNHPYYTLLLTQAYTAVNGVLTPNPRFGQPNATGGFPDGTNARRLQISVRLIW